MDETEGILCQIKNIQSLGVNVYVHCAKINTVLKATKQAAALLSRIKPDQMDSATAQAALKNLTRVLKQLQSMCVNCGRNVCLIFVLTTPIRQVFSEFVSIWNELAFNFDAIGLSEIGSLFKGNSEEIKEQNFEDIKRLFLMLVQLRKHESIKQRSDILQNMMERLKSISSERIQISVDDCDFASLPPIPDRINVEISSDQLVIGEEIGEGQSGTVYKATLKPGSKVVAVKVIKKEEFYSGWNIHREITTLSTVDHNTIVKMIGFTRDPLSIVTEYFPKTLQDALKARSLSPTEKTVIAIDIAHGLEYLHSRNIIHRDLKSANILLTDAKRAKICDFGLAGVCLPNLKLSERVGTIPWMAPEVLQESPGYDSKADVYSYGLILWELLTERVPYEDYDGDDLVEQIVMHGMRPGMPILDNSRLGKMIESCWNGNSSLRPSVPQILHMFAAPQYYFPGSDSRAVAKMANLQRRHTPSISDPSKMAGFVLDLMPSANRISGDSVRNPVAMNRLLEDSRRLIKTGADISLLLDDVMKTLKAPKTEQKDQLLRLLSEIISRPNMMEKFLNNDGCSFLIELLRSDDSAIEGALFLLESNINEGLATVEIIRQLFSFSSSDNQQYRIKAVEILMKIIDIRYDYLCTLPSFLLHYFRFAAKVLPTNVSKRFFELVARLIGDVPSLSEETILQMEYLLSQNKADKVLVLNAYSRALRFDIACNMLTYDVWFPAACELPTFREFFVDFAETVHINAREMVRALINAGSKNAESITMLTQLCQNSAYAEVTAAQLPTRVRHHGKLVLELYKAIGAFDTCLVAIASQVEFYQICKELLMSPCQADVCTLVRSIPVRQTVVESSGFHTRLVEGFLESSNSDCLWNLMSVIYTFNEQAVFLSFRLLCAKLFELLSSPEERLRLSSFLCLSKLFHLSPTGSDFGAFMKTAAEFSSSPLTSVQNKVYHAFKNNLSCAGSSINEVVETFLLANKTTRNEITPDIVRMIKESTIAQQINPKLMTSLDNMLL